MVRAPQPRGQREGKARHTTARHHQPKQRPTAPAQPLPAAMPGCEPLRAPPTLSAPPLLPPPRSRSWQPGAEGGSAPPHVPTLARGKRAGRAVGPGVAPARGYGPLPDGGSRRLRAGSASPSRAFSPPRACRPGPAAGRRAPRSWRGRAGGAGCRRARRRAAVSFSAPLAPRERSPRSEEGPSGCGAPAGPAPTVLWPWGGTGPAPRPSLGLSLKFRGPYVSPALSGRCLPSPLHPSPPLQPVRSRRLVPASGVRRCGCCGVAGLSSTSCSESFGRCLVCSRVSSAPSLLLTWLCTRGTSSGQELKNWQVLAQLPTALGERDWLLRSRSCLWKEDDLSVP